MRQVWPDHFDDHPAELSPARFASAGAEFQLVAAPGEWSGKQMIVQVANEADFARSFADSFFGQKALWLQSSTMRSRFLRD
jgi:hypothetical protein